MGGLFALGIVACVAGLIYCWDGMKPRRVQLEEYRYPYKDGEL